MTEKQNIVALKACRAYNDDVVQTRSTKSSCSVVGSKASCAPGDRVLVKLNLLMKRTPHADMKKCIRCYCCQKLCPKTDVKIRRNPIVALLK